MSGGAIDLVTCPNCGRRNSAENAYCANCGLRLPTAAARGTGVAYRRAEQAEPHGGGGQGLLAFGAVLLAGLLFAVGAVALLMSPSAASRTPQLGAVVSPTSSLAVFEQETPTPSPAPSVTPLPSYIVLTPTPGLSFTVPSFSAQPTPTPVQETPRPTPPRTPRPTPTETATPQPTPVNCAAANGSNVRSEFLGFGNPQSVGPIPRAWCIHRVIFRPYLNQSGETRLLENDERLAGDSCLAEECDPEKTKAFSPPHLTPAGSTLTYEFTCVDNPGTPNNECDPVVGGSTIEIQYEVVRGT
jgi:hypothetical protein